jgi:TRAP-type C4-dicarboxylate transport system permease small subunit
MFEKSQWQNMFDKVLGMDFALTGFAFVLLVLATFFGVIMRYVLTRPFIWLEEVQVLCIIWVIFLGCAAAFRHGAHVAIEVVVDMLPNRFRLAIERFNYILVILMLSYIAYQGYFMVRQLAITERVTNILGIPYWVVYAALPVGCVLSIVSYTYAMYKINKGVSLRLRGTE